MDCAADMPQVEAVLHSIRLKNKAFQAAIQPYCAPISDGTVKTAEEKRPVAEVSRSKNNASKAKRSKGRRLEVFKARQIEEAENTKRKEEAKKFNEAKRKEAMQQGRQPSEKVKAMIRKKREESKFGPKKRSAKSEQMQAERARQAMSKLLEKQQGQQVERAAKKEQLGKADEVIDLSE